MAYTDQATLARDTTFQDRIHIAIDIGARDILGEDEAGYTTQQYGKRQHLAYQVINNPAAYVERFAWAVAANLAITGASSDSDIQFTVNSLWDDMSGVTGQDVGE